VHNHLARKFKRVKMFLMDVDGVLARPQIIWAGQAGGKRLYEIKEFCVHDGSATWAAQAAGLILVVISGRDSLAIQKRIKRMKVNELCVGSLNKLKVLDVLKRKYKVSDDEIAYIGDDFLDLPIMERVGLPIAVRDATPEIKRVALFVTRAKGGEGAVGEALRVILKAQRKWDRGMRNVLQSAYR